MNTSMTKLDQLVTLLYQLEVAYMEMEDAPDVLKMRGEARVLAKECLFHPDTAVNIGAVMQMASHGFVLSKSIYGLHYIKSHRCDLILTNWV